MSSIKSRADSVTGYNRKNGLTIDGEGVEFEGFILHGDNMKKLIFLLWTMFIYSLFYRLQAEPARFADLHIEFENLRSKYN